MPSTGSTCGTPIIVTERPDTGNVHSIIVFDIEAALPSSAGISLFMLQPPRYAAPPRVQAALPLAHTLRRAPFHARKKQVPARLQHTPHSPHCGNSVRNRAQGVGDQHSSLPQLSSSGISSPGRSISSTSIPDSAIIVWPQSCACRPTARARTLCDLVAIIVGQVQAAAETNFQHVTVGARHDLLSLLACWFAHCTPG